MPGGPAALHARCRDGSGQRRCCGQVPAGRVPGGASWAMWIARKRPGRRGVLAPIRVRPRLPVSMRLMSAKPWPMIASARPRSGNGIWMSAGDGSVPLWKAWSSAHWRLSSDPVPFWKQAASASTARNQRSRAQARRQRQQAAIDRASAESAEPDCRAARPQPGNRARPGAAQASPQRDRSLRRLRRTNRPHP